MFTFKPAAKNGTNGNGNGNGNGHSNGNGNGNGHSPSNGNGNGNGNGHSNGNGNGHSPISGWLGIGSGHKNGNGAPRAQANGNGHSTKIESVIGPGINFQGNISGNGGIRIEGTFDGSINVKGSVVVADGAKVTADIQAITVSVAGSVKGNITSNKVEIRSTGRIFGDLVTTAFATEEGAFLRGQVRMEDEVPQTLQLASPEAALAEPAALPAEPAADAVS